MNLGIGHAEIQIGNSVIMLADEAPEYDMPGPQTLGGSPVTIELFLEDSDTVVAQAVAAGAKLVSPVEDQFYGLPHGESRGSIRLYLDDFYGERGNVGRRNAPAF